MWSYRIDDFHFAWSGSYEPGFGTNPPEYPGLEAWADVELFDGSKSYRIELDADFFDDCFDEAEARRMLEAMCSEAVGMLDGLDAGELLWADSYEECINDAFGERVASNIRIAKPPMMSAGGKGFMQYLDKFFKLLGGQFANIAKDKGGSRSWRTQLDKILTEKRNEQERKDKRRAEFEEVDMGDGRKMLVSDTKGGKGRAGKARTVIFEVEEDGKKKYSFATAKIGEKAVNGKMEPTYELYGTARTSFDSIDEAIDASDRFMAGDADMGYNKKQLEELDESMGIKSDEDSKADGKDDDQIEVENLADSDGQDTCQYFIEDKNRTCKNPPMEGSDYCWEHQNQAGRMASMYDEMMTMVAECLPRFRCAYINKSGRRCSRTAKVGNYCTQHAKMKGASAFDGFRRVCIDGDIVDFKSLDGGLELQLVAENGLYGDWYWRLLHLSEVVDEQVGESATEEEALADFNSSHSEKEAACYRVEYEYYTGDVIDYGLNGYGGTSYELCRTMVLVDADNKDDAIEKVEAWGRDTYDYDWRGTTGPHYVDEFDSYEDYQRQFPYSNLKKIGSAKAAQIKWQYDMFGNEKEGEGDGLYFYIEHDGPMTGYEARVVASEDGLGEVVDSHRYRSGDEAVAACEYYNNFHEFQAIYPEVARYDEASRKSADTKLDWDEYVDYVFDYVTENVPLDMAITRGDIDKGIQSAIAAFGDDDFEFSYDGDEVARLVFRELGQNGWPILASRKSAKFSWEYGIGGTYHGLQQDGPERAEIVCMNSSGGMNYDSYLWRVYEDNDARWRGDAFAKGESNSVEEAMMECNSRIAKRADNFATAPRVPDKVDIDSENVDACPLCGDPNFDGVFCNICGYEEPPEGFDDIELETSDDYEEYESDSEDEDKPQKPTFDPDELKLDKSIEDKANELAENAGDYEEPTDEEMQFA